MEQMSIQRNRFTEFHTKIARFQFFNAPNANNYNLIHFFQSTFDEMPVNFHGKNENQRERNACRRFVSTLYSCKRFPSKQQQKSFGFFLWVCLCVYACLACLCAFI